MTTKRRERITPYQGHVLMVLALRGPSTASDWHAWYPMTYEQVRPVISTLYRRGLVDVDGFKGSARTYRLTREGLAALPAEEREEEDDRARDD